VFTPDYPIHTERLSLRPFTMDDLDALHDLQSREDVTRYLYWNPRTRREAREALAQRVNQWRFDEINDTIALAVVRRDTGALIGTANLIYASLPHSQGELGYVLHPDHHGQGFATEVTVALLRLGFEGAGLHRVYGRCDGRNVASARVMEKAGMRREAHLRENEFFKGEWSDEIIFALLAKEWPSIRR
jgi:RimJ/RimL family protein N-acetyltransferase